LEIQSKKSLSNIEFFGKVSGVDPILKLNDLAVIVVEAIRTKRVKEVKKYLDLFREIMNSAEPAHLLDYWYPITIII